MILLFYLVLSYNILGAICQSNRIPRLFPACSLIESTLYCFGGTTSFNRRYYDIINEHISLDLSILNDNNNSSKTTTSISGLQWKNVSNIISTSSSPLPPIMRGATATIQSNHSYLIYSGASTNNTLTQFIYNYHAPTNQWSTLSLPTANNYTSDGSMINLGNDTIWVWGGKSLTNESINSNVYSTFDYNHLSWSQSITNNWQMLTGYSTTLTQNGIIYILGGYDDYNNRLVNFTQIRTFNSQHSTWSNINSTNAVPSNRMYHSVSNIPDKNLLFIYGGIFFNRSTSMMIDDVTYVYNYINNTFTPIALPTLTSPSPQNITRFGHFATILNQSKHLLLAFGFNDISVGANQINVLNIADPYHPSWVTQTVATPTPTPSPIVPDEITQKNGLSGGEIAAIVICTIIALCIIFAIIFFCRRRRNNRNQNETRSMISKQDYLQRGIDDQYNINENQAYYGSYISPSPPKQQQLDNNNINEKNILSSYQAEHISPSSSTSPSSFYPTSTNDKMSPKGIKSYDAQLNYDMFNSPEFDYTQQQQQHHHQK
ncbi:hypothetical protein BJ944DRAFT_245540 [Cunninghamella echinulata]|nr:hypothetical protein BJ944DRAFT_245540 [Cunninghamella echinulata]